MAGPEMNDWDAAQIIAALTEPVGDRRTMMRQMSSTCRAASVAGAIQSSGEPETQVLLANVLGEMRSADGIDSLLICLRATSSSLRAAAADALGKVFGYVPDPPASRRSGVCEALKAQVLEEGAPSAKSTMMQTLALVECPGAGDVLRGALNDPDARVRGQAKWGLEFLARR